MSKQHKRSCALARNYPLDTPIVIPNMGDDGAKAAALTKEGLLDWSMGRLSLNRVEPFFQQGN